MATPRSSTSPVGIGVLVSVLPGVCVRVAVRLGLGVAEGKTMEVGLGKIWTGDGVGGRVLVAVGTGAGGYTCGKAPISAATIVAIAPIIATM